AVSASVPAVYAWTVPSAPAFTALPAVSDCPDATLVSCTRPIGWTVTWPFWTWLNAATPTTFSEVTAAGPTVRSPVISTSCCAVTAAEQMYEYGWHDTG